MQWLSGRSFATNTYTPKLARLKTGFLIKEIFQRFSNKSASLSNPKQSMWIYSAHDTTVANLLNSLGLFEVCSGHFLLSIAKRYSCDCISTDSYSAVHGLCPAGITYAKWDSDGADILQKHDQRAASNVYTQLWHIMSVEQNVRHLQRHSAGGFR